MLRKEMHCRNELKMLTNSLGASFYNRCVWRNTAGIIVSWRPVTHSFCHWAGDVFKPFLSTTLKTTMAATACWNTLLNICTVVPLFGVKQLHLPVLWFKKVIVLSYLFSCPLPSSCFFLFVTSSPILGPITPQGTGFLAVQTVAGTHVRSLPF